MNYKKEVTDMNDLDYSSKECQLLIREYTRLIGKIEKEYDLLAAENVKLRDRLSMYGQSKHPQRFIPDESLSKTGKVWRSLRIYGLQVTLKKIIKGIKG